MYICSSRLKPYTMKIAIICEVLGKANNGTSLAAYNLINYLQSQGHDVRVVCSDDDKRGLPGYYILPKNKLVSWIIQKNQLSLSKFDKSIVSQAVDGVDIVHIMVPLFLARPASKYVKSLGLPLTAGCHAQAQNLTSHIFLVGCDWANTLTYKWYDHNLFCRADAIHYPTKFMQDEFEAAVGRKTNGYIISNGVNDLFKPDPCPKPEELKDRYCIVYTGRFSKEKSHITLLKAVAQSKYKDKIQLIFCGNGPYDFEIRDWAKRHLPIQPIMGFFSREEVLKILNFADLYCHPAQAELEGIACLEAIACGLVPVIADSPHCATKNFALDPHCLFKVGDSKELAQRIDWFIEHPDEKAALRQRYIEESVLYDQTKCMKEMENMFQSVIEAHAKA